MNREIKFRAWDEKRNKMFRVIEIKGFIDSNDKTVVGFEWDDLGELDTFENPILMQFTGLIDKQGKEIYEGDILKRKYLNFTWIIGQESFYQDVADLERFLERGDNYEIIGNIYENKELLKP